MPNPTESLMSPAKSPASVMTADGRKLSGQAAVSYVNAREREAAQNRRDTACLDTLSALVEVAGRDLVLRRIARNHGTERAEAAADVLGLAPGAFTEELDRQHQTVRQATRKLSNPTEVPGFGTLDFDPLDFPVVMDLMVVRQLPYTHPQVQEAIGQIIAQRGGAIRPVVGPGGYPAEPTQPPVQRTHYSSNPAAQYNAETGQPLPARARDRA